MFTATGIGASANRDGTITVKVRIVDDRTNTTVDTRDYTAKDLNAVKDLITADLQARREAESDAVLNKAITGQVLGNA